MAPPKQPQPKFPEPAKKRSLLWLWVGIAAVVLIAGVVAIVTSGDDKELSVGSVPTTVDSSRSASSGLRARHGPCR